MSDSEADIPDCSIYEVIANSKKKYGSGIAVNYYGRKMNYSCLLKSIDKCAAALHSLNVGRGDHISVILPNIPQAVILFYASNRIGAICDMIHPLSSVHELENYIRQSEARIVFAFEALAPNIGFISQFVEKVFIVSASESLPALSKLGYKIRTKTKNSMPEGFETYRDFIAHADKAAVKQVKDIEFSKPDEPCAVLYTGGTTGKPKGVLLSSRNFNASADEAIDSCGCLKAGDKMLEILPVFHGFGLGVGVHTVLMFGGTTILMPTFKMKSIDALINRYKPEILAGVPAIFGAMIAGVSKNCDMSFVKLVISGGDRLPNDIMRSFNELLVSHGSRTTIRQGYGLTECLSGVCLVPEHCAKDNCIGSVYKDTRFRIVGIDSNEELVNGESGEILICGPAVMLGYLNEPEESDNALERDNYGNVWLHTGDCGHIGDDGLVYFDSRIKRMIISNGYNIYPGVLEDVISAHESVLECCVTGIPDRMRGEIVKAFIVFDYSVIKRGEEDEALKSIKNDLKLSVSKYQLPRSYMILEELPRTAIGKIDAEALIRTKHPETCR